MSLDVADNQCQPVEGAEDPGRVTILGAIVDGAAVLKVRHPLLRELAADNVMSKTLQGIAIIRSYRFAVMDVEAAVMPRHQQINVPLGDGSIIQQHLSAICAGRVVPTHGHRNTE